MKPNIENTLYQATSSQALYLFRSLKTRVVSPSYLAK